jgi:hypothetical protein
MLYLDCNIRACLQLRTGRLTFNETWNLLAIMKITTVPPV